jgi:hypothetical protein
MNDRRSEPRLMCAELVHVVIEGDRATHGTVAVLEDISPSGACVQLERAARQGADVEIVCAKCRLKGKVRYCRFFQIGYDVGIEFDERGAWDQRQYEPDHLLEFPKRGRR